MKTALVALATGTPCCQYRDSTEALPRKVSRFAMANRQPSRRDERGRKTPPPIEPWQFEAVREAALAVASELSTDNVLQKLVDAARDLVKARYAALGVTREDRRGLSQFIISGISEETIRSIPNWPVGLGLLGVLLTEPTPLRVKEIGKDPRSVGFPPGHPKMTSFLGVPIMSKGRILGNLYLTDKIGADEFSETDESLIVLFAAHAAVAIENARLYSETNQQLKDKIVQVERAEQRSRFLAELSSLLFSRRRFEALPFDQVAKAITDVLGDACAILLLNPANPEKVVKTVLFHSDPSRARLAKDLLDRSWLAIKEAVIDKGRPVFVANVSAGPLPFVELDPNLMKERRFNAAIILPLKTPNRLHGILASLASIPLTFSNDDLAFGLLVAERLAVALDNAYLFDELSAALRTRDEFISVATHELKTPITTLKGYAQAAARPNANPDLQRKALKTINRQSDRLVSLVNELLDVSRIRAGKLALHPERVDMVRLASEVLQRFEVEVRDGVKYQLHLEPAQPEIWGTWDPTRIDQVLTNLIGNAIKYSPEGGTIKVTVKEEGGKAFVAVSDQGVGIPREEQSRIFDPFFRAENVARLGIEGTGLGLHITKEIVERHGGRIWFESEEGKGTTFFVGLPLAHEGAS